MAGNSITLKFRGMNNLRHLLKDYGQDVIAAAFRDVGDTTIRCAERTRAAAPIDTGALQASIKATVVTDGYTIRGKVRVGVPYAAFVEFGTEHTPKQPHLVPAAVDERKKMQERISATLVNEAPRELGKPGIRGHDSALPTILIE